MTSMERMGEVWSTPGQLRAASRHAAGLNQHRLTSLAGYSRSTIANAETRRQHMPRGLWARCDEVLGTGTALVKGGDEAPAAQRPPHMGDAAAAQHIRAITSAGIQAGAAEPVAAGTDGLPVPAIGPDEAVTIRPELTKVLTGGATAAARPGAGEQAVLPHGASARERAPGELPIEAGTDLAGLEMAVTRCRPASPMRPGLRVTAHMPGLMRLLSARLDGHMPSRRRAGTAGAAAEAGDARTFSCAPAQEGDGYFHSGDLPGAVGVARHAQSVVRGTPWADAAPAAAPEARAHAARSNTRQTQRALGRAESLLSALDAGSLAGSAFTVTPPWATDHEHWSPGQRGPDLPRQARQQPAAGSHWRRRPAACGGGAGW